ncbi:retrotransposon protein, putative, ty1-copia subclass, partial [Tanacetum coccineum]
CRDLFSKGLTLDAMNVEMQSMKDNKVWDLVDLPPNARLVAKGFTQTYGVDYEETFSFVADIRAIRILIAITAFYDYEIWQMDVKTAFLNRHLSEEVYMVQPEGFVNPKYPNRKFGFTQNRDEPCVYMKASGSNVTFLILYVDDILIIGNHIPMLQDVKSYLGKCFAMKDLGEAGYIFGIKIYIDRSKRLIGLCQSAYIEKILKRFYMENSKRGSILMQEKLKLSKSQGASTHAEVKRIQNIPYALAMGSIMYATVVKNILKYLRNTKDLFLVYGGDIKQDREVCCYTDAGYLTNADDLKSQTGYVIVLYEGAVYWKSTKQSIFVTSFAEAEYIAASDTSKEAVWVKKFIFGLRVVPTIKEPINKYCDNPKPLL